MTVTILFMAVAAAILVWVALLQRVRGKPWIEKGPIEAYYPDRGAPERIGLFFFMGVVSSLFMLFGIAYYVRMQLADWQPLQEPALLWFNTIVLIAASVAFQWARMSLTSGNAASVRRGLAAAGVLSAVFLLGQFWAWRELNAMGYFVPANPASAFFFLITGLHALHLIGGMWVWARATNRAYTGKDIEQVRLSVELCSLYWHFLLLLWLAVFGLLLST